VALDAQGVATAAWQDASTNPRHVFDAGARRRVDRDPGETRKLNRWASEVTADLRGVGLREVTVRIRARTTAGKLVIDTRVYNTCGRPA
jgi:hypothetical protein